MNTVSPTSVLDAQVSVVSAAYGAACGRINIGGSRLSRNLQPLEAVIPHLVMHAPSLDY